MFTRDVYKDSKAPAYALLAVTLRKYGLSALEEEPELLRAEIDRDYDIKLSDLQTNKLQAAITVMLTDHFEHDWKVFETIGHAINGSLVDHDILTPLEAEEIAVMLAEAVLIKSDTGENRIDYGDEVRAYAGLIFHDYGMHKAPKIFPQAIMPKSVECDDKEKNLALKELFDAHVEYVLDYMERMH